MSLEGINLNPLAAIDKLATDAVKAASNASEVVNDFTSALGGVIDAVAGPKPWSGEGPTF